jgi:hypothetical protein
MLPNDLQKLKQNKEKQDELEFQQIASVWRVIKTILTAVLLVVVLFILANFKYHWLY